MSHSSRALPTRVGPWVVGSVFARGGMGAVARVVRDGDGAEGALKWIGATTAAVLRSFSVEVRALRRLRHPQIVGILDHGIMDGHPWHVMELVRGRPLRQILQLDVAESQPTTDFTPSQSWAETPAAEPGPAPVSTVRALAALHSMCRPLATLHAEGLVHGDLKPENAVLRPDGEVVLIDFGLAKTFLGRERLDLEGRRAGTAAYAAPEVLHGEVVDGRTDLYALGCMLFEAVAGRPPFPGGPTVAARGHLLRPPPDLSHLVPETPPALAELVSALLAKEPGDRPAHADEIARVLRSCGVDSGSEWQERRGSLVRASLVGRRATLRSAIEGVGVQLLTGPPGVGRTRLLWEIGHQLENERRRHVDLRADPDADDCVLARVVRPLAGPSLAEELEPLLRADPDHPAEIRASTWAAVAATLTAAGPVTVLIDDLHAHDEITRAFVAWAAGAAPPGVTIVATADPTERALIAATLDHPAATVSTVAPLAPTDAVQMAAGLLGEPVLGPYSDIARAAAEGSAGVPADLVLVLRQWCDAGLVVRAEGRWEWAGGRSAPPESPSDWIGRLASDPVHAAFALFGPDPERALALGLDPDEVHSEWFRGVRSGLYELEPPCATSVRAARSIARSVPDDLAATLRRAALSAWADLPRPPFAVLAAAAAALGDPSAAAWSLRAARAFVAAGRREAAIEAFERVIALGTSNEAIAAHDGLCSLFHGSRAERLLAHARAARALAEADGTPPALPRIASEASALRMMGDVPAARELLEGALADDGAEVGRARVQVDLAAIRLDEGRPDEARELLEAVLASPGLGPETEFLANLNLGVAHLRADDPARSVTCYRAALGVLERRPVKDRMARTAGALSNLGAAQHVLGDLEGAEASWRRAVDLARRSGAARHLVSLSLNLSELAAARGDLADVRALLAEAAVAAQRSGSPLLVGLVALNRYSAERKAGGAPSATWLDDAEPALEAAGTPAWLCHLACERGHSALAGGQDARPWVARARALGVGSADLERAVDELAAACGGVDRASAAPRTDERANPGTRGGPDSSAPER